MNSFILLNGQYLWFEGRDYILCKTAIYTHSITRSWCRLELVPWPRAFVSIDRRISLLLLPRWRSPTAKILPEGTESINVGDAKKICRSSEPPHLLPAKKSYHNSICIVFKELLFVTDTFFLFYDISKFSPTRSIALKTLSSIHFSTAASISDRDDFFTNRWVASNSSIMNFLSVVLRLFK